MCVCVCAFKASLIGCTPKTEHEKFSLAGEATAGYERGRKSEEEQEIDTSATKGSRRMREEEEG